MFQSESEPTYKHVFIGALNKNPRTGPGSVANFVEKILPCESHMKKCSECGHQRGFDIFTIADFDEDGLCGYDIDYSLFLQDIGRRYFELWALERSKKFVGPNVFVTPDENPYVTSNFDRFIVPSQWVKNKYYSYDQMKNKKIYIWSAGIDVDSWTPDESKQQDLDCFIYFKNRSHNDLKAVKALCKINNLKYEVVQYGNYTNDQLYDLCNRSKFAILLTGTESQGIAYMQILSTNTPCYVFNKPYWTPENKQYPCFSATSVPYFDDKCGMITDEFDREHFKDFLKWVDNFLPREYILRNHTERHSFDTLFDIMENG